MYLSPNRRSIMNDDFSAIHTNQALAGRFSAIQPTLIERQREIEQKEVELRKQFAEIDVNHDGKVGAEELLNFLDQRSDGEFERNIMNELFKRLDQDMDGKITIDEFIATYLDAQENLRAKITENIKMMADHTRQRDEIKNKITEAKIEERTTKYGIMEGSILTVNLVEARDLFQNSKKVSSFVIFTIEEQQMESRLINSSNSPVWNESISFDIYHGQEPLKIRVMNREAFSDEEVGSFEVHLVTLKDQMKHEDWFPIFLNGQENGKLRLVTQWIHSKVLFLTDVLRRWEETLAADTEQKARLDALLQQLRRPFGFLGGEMSREVSRNEPQPGGGATLSTMIPKVSIPPTGLMMKEVEKAMFESKISKAMDNYLYKIGIKDSVWWKYASTPQQSTCQ